MPLPAAVLVSMGCSVAFSEAPFALKVRCRAGDRRRDANGLGRSAQCRLETQMHWRETLLLILLAVIIAALGTAAIKILFEQLS
jgi:hypothetical protein